MLVLTEKQGRWFTSEKRSKERGTGLISEKNRGRLMAGDSEKMR